MSNVHQLNEQAALAEKELTADEIRLDTASDWIAKLDRGLSDIELSLLNQWLEEHKENKEVLFEVAKMWDKMDDLSRLSDIFPQHGVVHSSSNANVSHHSVNRTKGRKTAGWFGAIAASLFIALTMGVYQNFGNGLPFIGSSQSSIVAMQASYQTGIGESNTIHLPDNSKIVLNTNSFVQVKYTATARIIDLQRGELHIDVAHDKSRPLSVVAGGTIIQAVGTAFNVDLRSELFELLVTDGKVLVSANKMDLLANTDKENLRLPSSSMAISKGEKITIDLIGQQQEKVVQIDPLEIAASLSWRQGNLIFRGESLAEVMAEISRYTNIEFELAEDEKLRAIKVAGMFKTGDVTGLLNVLNQSFNISYEKINQNKISLKYVGS
jgi:transmembrane sensor